MEEVFSGIFLIIDISLCINKTHVRLEISFFNLTKSNGAIEKEIPKNRSKFTGNHLMKLTASDKRTIQRKFKEVNRFQKQTFISKIESIKVKQSQSMIYNLIGKRGK